MANVYELFAKFSRWQGIQAPLAHFLTNLQNPHLPLDVETCESLALK